MRIGDLAARSGLTTKSIRFYEDCALLPAPLRTPGGYRDYPDHTVTRLGFVRDAQRAGLTLAEIRRSSPPPAMNSAPLPTAPQPPTPPPAPRTTSAPSSTPHGRRS
ncbi:MerR family transcriptional regulator [Streptomyces sp. NPDC004393]